VTAVSDLTGGQLDSAFAAIAAIQYELLDSLFGQEADAYEGLLWM